jgi:hypothetical protein
MSSQVVFIVILFEGMSTVVPDIPKNESKVLTIVSAQI